MDGIDRNPDLKKLLEQLQRKGEKVKEEAAKDPRGESNALRDPLDEYERLEGIFEKNIIEHCQKDVDNSAEQYDVSIPLHAQPSFYLCLGIAHTRRVCSTKPATRR